MGTTLSVSRWYAVCTYKWKKGLGHVMFIKATASPASMIGTPVIMVRTDMLICTFTL